MPIFGPKLEQSFGEQWQGGQRLLCQYPSPSVLILVSRSKSVCSQYIWEEKRRLSSLRVETLELSLPRINHVVDS
jgi:hypothetical protein